MPIDPVLPELCRMLRDPGMAVLVAPPGAGKTTQVPLALLTEPWLDGKKLLMLEPRRLAARSAARYMASKLGEQVGETIGYRVRMDTRTGPSTRIEVVTEGVLTRMLQDDPSLEGVGGVLFDEFHERNLHADLGLALCLQSRELLREDLRLVVMSATLEPEPVALLMGGAPVLVSSGRSYPVDTVYRERPLEGGFGALETAVARTVLTALDQHPGDALVFLPGLAEIRRTEERLTEWLADGRRGPVLLAPLYGDLSSEEQDRALTPASPGMRKVVLATSIAETSLTVEGVRIVVDSGLMRVSRFSPRTGMTRLVTVPVSGPAADQRRGRAGRVAPGVCYRLWTADEQSRLAPRSTPEMHEADLAPLALELAAWGACRPRKRRRAGSCSPSRTRTGSPNGRTADAIACPAGAVPFFPVRRCCPPRVTSSWRTWTIGAATDESVSPPPCPSRRSRSMPPSSSMKRPRSNGTRPLKPFAHVSGAAWGRSSCGKRRCPPPIRSGCKPLCSRESV
uniref:helicase-related protein n=1 Tax=Gorillibacterium timonense TaxID=1689269 RepID=UPI0037096ED2